jgi:tetratricopeptide (TPR) repeat protein
MAELFEEIKHEASSRNMTGQPSSPEVPTGAARGASRWPTTAVCLALAAITFAVFGQTLAHGFVDYDDNQYVYENPVVSRGLTLKGIVWAFTSVYAYNWHPLTWLSHMLDCQLYGLNPAGHHLTNILLHTATVIALFLVLRQLTGAFWRSAFVAAVFAIHPLRVESVAWVAERKDVLSGLFFMLTIGAYARYARLPWSAARYGLVMLLFAMGLMCKPMLVTLPVVLLLLDYWPLRRAEPARRLLLEKLPLLMLSAAACVMTVVAQTGAIESTGSSSLPNRLGNALTTCMVYLGQMVYPAGLAVFYPFPHHGLPILKMALAGALLAGVSTLAWNQRVNRPWLLTGWLWYLVMLMPVLGIIQVGDQAHADRYTYLPQIGIYMAMTWLAAEWGLSRAAFGGLMAAVVAVLMVCAWKQTTFWQSNETLWRRAVACTTDNDKAQFNLGVELDHKGMVDEGIDHYQKALEINPSRAEAYINLGAALLKKGKVDEAIAQYQKALQLVPRFAAAHNNLGNIYRQMGRLDEAIAQFQEALQIDPNVASHHFNLGLALFQKGKADEAIAQYHQALALNEDDAETHYSLGNALRQKGRVDDAIAQYRQALQIRPDYADACNNLGNALLQQGQVDEAIIQLESALEINPRYARAHSNLGNALLKKGDVAGAIGHFQEAAKIEPGNPVVRNNLAWLLATFPQASLRNGHEAVEVARQANELTGGENPVILRTLAAAYAEAGRFPEAVETAQHALRAAEVKSNARLIAQLKDELKLFQADTPYHSP